MWERIYTYIPPDIARAGSTAKQTNVISHPVMNAKINHDINVAIGIIKVPTFSPTPYWKLIVSAENFDAN